MDKAQMLGRIRMLQRVADELAGMVAAMPETIAPPPPPPPTAGEGQEILSARQVQALLGIGESTFYTWIREGRLPPGELWGKKMRRWKRSDVMRWRPKDEKMDGARV